MNFRQIYKVLIVADAIRERGPLRINREAGV